MAHSVSQSYSILHSLNREGVALNLNAILDQLLSPEFCFALAELRNSKRPQVGAVQMVFSTLGIAPSAEQMEITQILNQLADYIYKEDRNKIPTDTQSSRSQRGSSILTDLSAAICDGSRRSFYASIFRGATQSCAE